MVENWFPVKEVKEKRSQIANLIIHQAQAENEGKLVFPALRFESLVGGTSKMLEMKASLDDTNEKRMELYEKIRNKYKRRLGLAVF